MSTITVITSRRIRRVMHVARMGERENEHTVLVATVARKLPRGRPRRRRKDNIRINLI